MKRPAKRPEGTVFFIAPTRFEGSEGQRSYHLALEFARRGWKVVFGYWRWQIGDERPGTSQESGIFELPLDVLLMAPERVPEARRRGRRPCLPRIPRPGGLPLPGHGQCSRSPYGLRCRG